MYGRDMNPPSVTDEDRTSEPQVTLIRQVFSLVCRVEVNIRATAPAIWHILSDAKYPAGSTELAASADPLKTIQIVAPKP